MKNIWTILQREFASYFASPIAYVFMIVFLLGTGIHFAYIGDVFTIDRTEMRLFFETLPMTFLVLVPALTMRLWSEERKLGTFEVLMTLPMTPLQITLGKFTAAWGILGITLLFTLPIPIVLSTLGPLDWGPIAGGYLGSFLLGGAYLSIGAFASSISRDQIIAFILTALMLSFFVVIGQNDVLALVGDWSHNLVTLCTNVGFLPHFDSIARGVIDSRDILYFLSITGFFLALNRFTIESHRYA